MNAFDKNLEEEYCNNQVETQLHSQGNQFLMSDGQEEVNVYQHEFNDRHSNRLKEPLLSWGKGAEYGNELCEDNFGNKISSEIILKTGIPVTINESSNKYTSSQKWRGGGLDLNQNSNLNNPT